MNPHDSISNSPLLSGALSRRKLLQAGGALGLLGVASACGVPGSGSGGSSSKSAGTLIYATASVRDSYDTVPYYMLREGLAEGLFGVSFDAQVAPALATELSAVDELTWEFRLRPDVAFHNGEAVTAESVKWSLERAGQAKGTMTALKGMTVEVTDDGSGRIVTTAPVPALEQFLTDPSVLILHPDSYESDGRILKPVGTGPMTFVSSSGGEETVYGANKKYWGGAPGLKEVRWKLVSDPQTRVNMLRNGEVHVAEALSSDQVDLLGSVKGVKVVSGNQARIFALVLNTRSGPTADPRVRQALAMATDRDAIVEAIFKNTGTAQAALFASQFPWAKEEIAGRSLDVAGAKQLLTQAGYAADKPLRLAIQTYTSRAELPLSAQALQEQWKAIGVQVEVKVEEFNTIETTALDRGPQDILLYSWPPLYSLDPQPFFDAQLHGKGSYNLSGYSGGDDLLDQARTTADQDKRYGLLREFERKVIEDDVAMINLCSYNMNHGVSNDVSGLKVHPLDTVVLTQDLKRTE